jgi:hypothetical protein
MRPGFESPTAHRAISQDIGERFDFTSNEVKDLSKFDVSRRYFRDKHGVDGFGIQAYLDFGNDDLSVIEGYRIRVDRGIADTRSPSRTAFLDAGRGTPRGVVGNRFLFSAVYRARTTRAICDLRRPT